MSSKPKKVAIGIDLGSSKCCVGVMRDGKVEIIENERGNKTTPSYVAFTDTERLIGEDAKDQATRNPTNTVFGVKRIMGRKGDDPIVKSYAEKVPCVVVTDEQPVINVTYKEREESLLPEQISAMLLTKMKEMAEMHLGCEVHDAVISVPACFTNAQRQATKDAAQIAGLNVLRLINEPTAAAIAYEANRRTDAAETVVVVDFGGGKLDLSIIDIAKKKVNVKTVWEVADFGGSDIDHSLKDSFVCKLDIEEAKERSSKVSEKVRLACEQLKHSMSLVPAVQKTLVDCFGKRGAVLLSVTKTEFTNLVEEQVQSKFRLGLNNLLYSFKGNKEWIKKVIMVGGSTRIPLVQEMLIQYFSKDQLDQSVNADEAVAYGAAVQAALLAGDLTLQVVQVSDVVPYGLEIYNRILFLPYCTVPLHCHFERVHDLLNKSSCVQELILNNFCNGKYNYQPVGKMCLSEEFGKAASLITHICCDVDYDGVFNIKATLKPNHIFDHVGEKYDENMAKKKTDQMIKKERQFRKDASDEKERFAAMMELESSCLSLNKRAKKCKYEACSNWAALILDETSSLLNWLDSTKSASKLMYTDRTDLLQSLDYSFAQKINIEKEYEKLKKMIIKEKEAEKMKQSQTGQAEANGSSATAFRASDNDTQDDAGRARDSMTQPDTVEGRTGRGASAGEDCDRKEEDAGGEAVTVVTSGDLVQSGESVTPTTEALHKDENLRRKV